MMKCVCVLVPETEPEMAKLFFFMSVITSGWMVRVSHCGCAITPASVSHSLAAPSLRPHKGCQRTDRQTDRQTSRQTDRQTDRQCRREAAGRRLCPCTCMCANEREDWMNVAVGGCELLLQEETW